MSIDILQATWDTEEPPGISYLSPAPLISALHFRGALWIKSEEPRFMFFLQNKSAADQNSKGQRFFQPYIFPAGPGLKFCIIEVFI